MPIETRKSCLMKKTGHKKSRDTVPLTNQGEDTGICTKYTYWPMQGTTAVTVK